MLRLASDADVNGDIIRGLRRRVPEIDLVRAIGSAIEDIVLVAECMLEEEIKNQIVVFLPFRG
jgi:hypothetical protein